MQNFISWLIRFFRVRIKTYKRLKKEKRLKIMITSSELARNQISRYFESMPDQCILCCVYGEKNASDDDFEDDIEEESEPSELFDRNKV